MRQPMPLKSFDLSATVLAPDPERVRALLERVLGRRATVNRVGDDLRIQATQVVGVEARELNRKLLSELRGVDGGVRMSAAWTADGRTEAFRDYVFQKRRGGRLGRVITEAQRS